MKIRKYSILLSLCMLSSVLSITSHAQESYQRELSLGYTSSEDNANKESKFYGVTAEVYFSPVDTKRHPYAEAAFLGRVGSVGLLVGEMKEEQVDIKGDGHLYGAMLNYMKPDLPIAILAAYGRGNFEFTPNMPLDVDVEIDFYHIEVGRFLSDGLLLSIGYSHKENDLIIPAVSLKETTKNDDYTLATKFVKEKMDGTAYNVEGNLGISQTDDGTDSSSNTIIGASGDYYFDRRTSLGGGLEINKGDDKDDEGKTLAIDFNTFVTPSFSINMSFEKFLADNNEGEDEKTVSIDILTRF